MNVEEVRYRTLEAKMKLGNCMWDADSALAAEVSSAESSSLLALWVSSMEYSIQAFEPWNTSTILVDH